MEEESSDNFLQSLQTPYKSLLKNFKKTVRFSFFFNLFFVFLFAVQISVLRFFSISLNHPLIAFTLASFFLSLFSYFILLFYFQTKKPEQIKELQETFRKKCHTLLREKEESYLLTAHAYLELVDYLKNFEKGLYPFLFPKKLSEGFSKFCHFEDVFRFKKLFLESAIEEHYLHIRTNPLDLEAHTSLANVYTSFSKSILEIKKELEASLFYKIRFRKLYQTLEESFRKTSERAVEEFKILQHYVPEDPWVHLQLAKNYGALNMPKEEISEYETLQTLLPFDAKITARLGALYFQQGFNGKGLVLYEKLKLKHPQKAEELISHYGKFSSSNIEESF